MEILGVLISYAVALLIFAIVARWIFRIDYIVKVLEKSEKHLEDIKKQNNTLIKQQDEIAHLLDMER